MQLPWQSLAAAGTPASAVWPALDDMVSPDGGAVVVVMVVLTVVVLGDPVVEVVVLVVVVGRTGQSHGGVRPFWQRRLAFFAEANVPRGHVPRTWVR
jgi:hypothetical protein